MYEKLGEPGDALWRYWSSLRRSGLVPDRGDFEPRAIARHLPIVSLIEREAAMVWRIRLVGTEIDARSGLDLTGRNFIDLLTPASRDREDRRLAALLARPCGAVGLRRNLRQSGLEYLVRTVSLPLRAADGEIRLVIATNQELQRGQLLSGDSLSALQVEDREFLDIGAGTPDPIR